METERQYYRTLDRITKAAERETALVLKALPKELRERVKDASIRYKDKPTREMIANGLSDEAFSLMNRESRQIVIFLMNIFGRYGKRPGEFTAEFRKVLAKELADWSGMDVDMGEA